jgi:hypothetical protein
VCKKLKILREAEQTENHATARKFDWEEKKSFSTKKWSGGLFVSKKSNIFRGRRKASFTFK